MVGVGQTAVFRCQNPNAAFILWMVNETQATFNMPHPDPAITIRATMDRNNDVLSCLSIVAQLKFNETVIVCGAGSISGVSNNTEPVTLLIQGELPSQKIWRRILFGRLVVCLSVY